MVWDMNVLNLWYLNVGGSSSPMEHLGMAVENFQMNESYLPTETLMDSHQPWDWWNSFLGSFNSKRLMEGWRTNYPPWNQQRVYPVEVQVGPKAPKGKERKDRLPTPTFQGAKGVYQFRKYMGLYHHPKRNE